MNDFDSHEISGFNFLCGCDEVGRGPLAGPVVGGCALTDKENALEVFEKLSSLNVTDSKKLNTKKRREIIKAFGISLENLETNKIYPLLDGKISLCLFEMSPEQIDKINILQASLQSMANSFSTIVKQQSLNGKMKVLVDGNKLLPLEENIIQRPVVKGDSKSLLIGLASVFAKEYRDHLMEKYEDIYPGYGLGKHAGYPTKAHKEALVQLGVTPIHRKTFKGVKELL